ncbi:EF-hand domain-containing family member C2-like [Teleopsis dalmanni]|nr:EF-hand domain-containing family member C2-like [Teleopsis dalmanni]
MTYKGISMLNDRLPPKLVEPNGMIADPNCPPVQIPSLHPPKSGPRLPPWLAYDKQCLCFHAYFKETLQEVYHAPYQVRKVKIYFYLEDGTMQIIEPCVRNSGIPQGCLVHRQRIPKPPPCESEFLTLLDLNVDATVQIYDRVYHITNCDRFTRNFLNRAGISVPDPIDEPADPTAEYRKREGIKIVNPPAKKHPFTQFLLYDRQILKFHGYWDDRSEFGDVRRLELCYYLADDTIDIKEIYPRNSGREGPASFLRRTRLPRETYALPLPGQETPQTVLNVLGSGVRDVRYVIDPLNTGCKEVLYYSDRDLQIGAVINVFGRAVMLVDCDEFTRSYYRKKYGIEDFTPLPVPLREIEEVEEVVERILPPYNGWGTYEDSEGNCKSVEPKPPRIDFNKWYNYERYILRFGAKLLSTIPENCERSFVISYYLADDTIQIYEIAIRNSGFLGGEFLKRTRIELPGQKRFSVKRPLCYEASNFYIGATMNINDFIFTVVSADEFTLMYMEHNCSEFPNSDIKKIMEKVREAIRPNYKDFVGKCLPATAEGAKEMKFINYETVKRALSDSLGNGITNHEVITLCRYFGVEKEQILSCDREYVRSAAHLEIKRNLWNAIDELKEHLYHLNPGQKPFVSEMKIRSTLKGCRLPFGPELIDNILKVLSRNSCGDIEVCDFINFLDMGCGRVCDIPPMNIAFELCPKIPNLNKGRLINFACFLDELGLEKEVLEIEEEN